ncbi:MAG: M23 family metallopeptidase [bacterium]|nr:M23 family metallopeptidase [bacterium]
MKHPALFAGLLCGLLLLSLSSPTPAGSANMLSVECPDSLAEGRGILVRIGAPVGCSPITVEWLNREFAVEALPVGDHLEVEVLLGVGLRERNAEETYTLRVRAGEWSVVKTLQRIPFRYPEQHLDVPRKYTELSDEDLARHNREKREATEAKMTLSARRSWALPLHRPVPGSITSDFGLRRFFNGEPKLPHGGTDLRGAEGSDVRACAAGRVVLTGFHLFAGGSVYIDHGQGLISMYFHLSAIDVEVGRVVEAGETIARVGATGRVTGPHLHWGLAVHGCLIDPMPLLTTDGSGSLSVED